MGAPSVTDPEVRARPPRSNGRLAAIPVRPAVNLPWVLLGVLLVAGSALAFTVLGGGDDDDARVLVLAGDVAAGQPLTPDLLTSTAVSLDGDAHLAPASARSDFVGRIAVADLSAGTLVTEQLFTASSAIREGQALVGVALDPAAMPVSGLHTGDAVMVVQTPSAADPATEEEPAVWAAEVFGVTPVTTTGGDLTLVTLTVDPLDAPRITAAAAADRVRLVLLRSLDDVPPELLLRGLTGGAPTPAPETSAP